MMTNENYIYFIPATSIWRNIKIKKTLGKLFRMKTILSKDLATMQLVCVHNWSCLKLLLACNNSENFSK